MEGKVMTKHTNEHNKCDHCSEPATHFPSPNDGPNISEEKGYCEKHYGEYMDYLQICKVREAIDKEANKT